MENKTIVKVGFEIFAFASVGAATAFYRAAQLGERVDERYMSKGGFLCVHNDYKKLIMEEADVLTIQEYELLQEAENNAAKEEEAKKKAEENKALDIAEEEIKAILAIDAAVEDALGAPTEVVSEH